MCWPCSVNTAKRLCVCFCVCTCSQSLLSALVIIGRLSDVPGGQGQRLHVLDTAELQHVHMAVAALVPWDEAAFASFEHVFNDLPCMNFIIHAEKHCNPLTGHILGMLEQLVNEDNSVRCLCLHLWPCYVCNLSRLYNTRLWFDAIQV